MSKLDGLFYLDESIKAKPHRLWPGDSEVFRQMHHFSNSGLVKPADFLAV